MTSAKEIVERYKAAMGRGDFTAARELLHDDLAFHGSIDTFSRADDYIAAASGWRTSSNVSTSRRSLSTATMYACSMIWSPTRQPEQLSSPNGIRFGATRLLDCELCSMRAHSPRCLGSENQRTNCSTGLESYASHVTL